MVSSVDRAFQFISKVESTGRMVRTKKSDVKGKAGEVNAKGKTQWTAF